MDEAIRHFTRKLAYETDPYDLREDLRKGEKIVVIDARSRDVKELIGGIEWWKKDGYETEGKG
ncbi:MAG: hypothetical protein A3F84_13450 [Candidatus Handelsmanbacteria bacterium RIFCSPLOWO2_12_FULL_64_10]|uniref:Rhodanese domain-containing protein n=1 Tax=Handelsmanbacteria sp. (strain RIFCSPLOWO2_12_FULL_64_10) TaxID=1817868 RepID=A0A1F6C3M2_HANXR|nr:MAG: hypothetical protein A3F84_13450 [Candidatus Handelsmanbacteria bacterium RIFCSPLOWO2_12_FULL_64_10]